MRLKAFSWLSIALVLTAAAVVVLRSNTPNNRFEEFITASSARSAAAATAHLPEARKQHVLGSYGRLPLSFEANAGQTDPQVKFLSRGRGYSVFLTNNEAVLALGTKDRTRAVDEASSRVGAPRKPLAPGAATPESSESRSAVLRMKLVGATSSPAVTGQQELPGRVNYFIGNDPAKWRRNVPTYAKVRYPEVYPGIDLVYYGNQRQLEYDFVVAPGANPSRIRLDFQGARQMRVDEQGGLLVETAGGAVRWEKPVIYQEIDGARKTIAGRYLLQRGHQVSFAVAAYDPTRPLNIDPTLVYSTYLGGGGDDEGLSIAVDISGNAYVTGYTNSADFPATTGAFQTTNGGSGRYDAFVTKLNAAGTARVYSTYLGGSGDDLGFNIAVDSTGAAYVTGSTSSLTDFPVKNPYQSSSSFTNLSDGYHAFVTKLNALGNGLVYSTYLGGTYISYEFGMGIAIDSLGQAVVTGQTFAISSPASTFPTTAGAFQSSRCRDYEAFVTKFNAAGNGLIYSTYLGSCSSPTYGGRAVAVDVAGNAYIMGVTTGGGFPTMNPYQGSFNGGSRDLFVTKFDLSGALLYSTYLGGSGADDVAEPGGIAVDNVGHVYVTGSTDSPNFPTANAAYATKNGGTDAFVAELDTTTSGTASLVYSTYLGGSGDDVGTGVALGSLGNIYVTGITHSTDFPTANPLPSGASTNNGTGGDAFVAKINPGNPPAAQLVYSTYLGGSGLDQGRGIAVDSSGNAYVAGLTASTDFPTMPGSFQTTFGGGPYDAFVAKITGLVSAFPSGGFFVVGDLNAVPGNGVTFWGAQWAKVNSLSGGAAPDAFKGFAPSAPPSCGGSWTSGSGNSSNPPASAPTYMTVIVSSSISKSGATIAGNVPKIVIVKTNPGYGPSPGQTGTGTVVSVLCGG